MRVLEIGSYVSVAYAGMILAEQGHEVTKWVGDAPDPVEGLRHGAALWLWLNDGKQIVRRHAGTVDMMRQAQTDMVIDNLRAEAWKGWGIDRAEQARRLDCVWVSLADDAGGRSFDAIAQARAWGDHVGYVPAYIGDTAAGLWMAFKGLSAWAAGQSGHFMLRQAACLAKLVEGELVVPSGPRGGVSPWDEPGSYGPDGDGVTVVYRGEKIHEPFRDEAWRRANLRHLGGRYVI